MTAQLSATFCGQPSSSRRARPRACTTEVGVVAAVKSMTTFTAGASQPSPSRARVPMRQRDPPSAKNRVTSGTYRRGSQPATAADGRDPEPDRPRTPWPPGPGAASLSQSDQRRRRVGARRPPAGRSSAPGPGLRSPRPPAGSEASAAPRPRPRRGPGERRPGWSPPASAKSVSTSARSWSPSSPCSARRISAAALALLADRASTRSTGDSAARIPARVSRYPIDGSAARIASYAALSSAARPGSPRRGGSRQWRQ